MKLDIQRVAEAVLLKHGIDPDAKEYYLKLHQPGYMDLVIERTGSQILVGHYCEQNGDLISDPVLAMDYNGGYWYPVRIEQFYGETVCSFIQDGKRMAYPKRISEFKEFQRMFARNIKAQGWLCAECVKAAVR